MSELTDNAIAMLRICVHDGTENTAQVYFAQLLNQISAIEEVRDDWYRAWKQEQAARSLADDEVERVKAERDAWKATAARAAKYCMAAGVVCDFCPHDSNNCIGKPCPVVDVQHILAHFGAPEEDA